MEMVARIFWTLGRSAFVLLTHVIYLLIYFMGTKHAGRLAASWQGNPQVKKVYMTPDSLPTASLSWTTWLFSSLTMGSSEAVVTEADLILPCRFHSSTSSPSKGFEPPAIRNIQGCLFLGPLFKKPNSETFNQYKKCTTKLKPRIKKNHQFLYLKKQAALALFTSQ